MSFADSDPQRLENSRFRTTTELGCVHFDITYIYTPPPLDGRREGRLENAPPSIKKEGKKKEGVKERARKRGRGESRIRSCIRYCVTDHRKRRIGTDGNRQRTDRPNAGRV
jgi:hypothetical protein